MRKYMVEEWERKRNRAVYELCKVEEQAVGYYSREEETDVSGLCSQLRLCDSQVCAASKGHTYLYYHLRPWWHLSLSCSPEPCLDPWPYHSQGPYWSVHGPCHHQWPCGCPWCRLLPKTILMSKGPDERALSLAGPGNDDPGPHRRDGPNAMGAGKLVLPPRWPPHAEKLILPLASCNMTAMWWCGRGRFGLS